MIQGTGGRGCFNEKVTVLVTLTSIKRASVDLILTYNVKGAARWLTEK